MPTLHHRTCSLCEAVCGITVTLEGTTVVAIRGDEADPFSRGHVCPKAVALQDLQADPDRLRRPLRRTADGWEELDWDTALDDAARRIAAIQDAHGRDAVALYTGNPVAHNFATALVMPGFHKALGTRNRYSSSSVDELPLSLTAWAMYGNRFLAPVPDIDRTSFFLILGANPHQSNGSAMTAPGVMDRIAAIRARGGTVVLVDPRRHETAAHVDQHLFIRPNTDAFFLMALLAVIFEEGLARPGRLADRIDGLEVVRVLASRFPPERVAARTGIAADTMRALARAFAAAPSAVCYGRMGVSTQAFGATCHWLMNVLNAVTGNLDKVGGAMFSRPAVDLALGAARTGHRGSFGRWRSRVAGLPEFDGELPVAAFADEILTPVAAGAANGIGTQVRGVVTVAGNPVLSAPNGGRLDQALGALASARRVVGQGPHGPRAASVECVVAVDMYLNETTRHAHLILPPTGPLERDHYDVLYYVYAVHNAARFSTAAFPRAADARHDWEILVELGLRIRRFRRGLLGRTVGRLGGALRAWFTRRMTPHRLLDLLIRSGPHGDFWNPFSKRLSLAKLKKQVHGVDLGPHVPCLPKRLFTRGKRIALAPAIFVADVERLEAALNDRTAAPAPESGGGRLTLVGRRQLRSNNSWLHNSERLVKGKDRCTLLLHPDDAAARGMVDGARVRVSSEQGSIEVRLEVTDTMMPGVASLPHGWGHGLSGARQAVAKAHAGASFNTLSADGDRDELSGAAGFSRTQVWVEAVTP